MRPMFWLAESTDAPEDSLEIPDKPLVLVYGAGRGSYLDEKREWVLIDHDPGRLSGHPERANVTLVHLDVEDEEATAAFCQSYIGRDFGIAIQQEYRDQFPEKVREFCLKVEQRLHSYGRIVHEYTHQMEDFYFSAYANIRRWKECYWGNALFGKFEGVPAIICGAGPSLDPEEIAKYRDQALIIAGGSAINALGPVRPHFLVGCDPFPAQMERFLENQAFELPIFFRHRWHIGARMVSHGPLLYLNGATGSGLVGHLEERLGIVGEDLDEGHNVINFAVNIAHKLGCSPIVLSGLDLAYTNDQSYAPGVVGKPAADGDQPIEWTDKHGMPIMTHKKWLAEAEWLGQVDAELINATPGGLKIPNVPDRPLTTLGPSRPLDEMVHAAVQEAKLPLKGDPEPILQEIKASLLRCQTKLDQLAGETSLGKRALLEVELEEEVAYDAVIAPFAAVHKVALKGDRTAFLQQAVARNLELIGAELSI